MTVRVRRVYEPATPDDGFRVLVDRLWPRGVSKEQAHVDLWLRDVAPSTDLRRWFHHDGPDHDDARFDDFGRRYRKELADNPAVAELREVVGKHAVVTLLFGARDPERNQAVVLRDYLTGSGS